MNYQCRAETFPGVTAVRSIAWAEIIGSVIRRLWTLGVSRSALWTFSIFLAFSTGTVCARVLTSEELERISTIRTSFTRLLTEIAQASKQPDLSANENECINSVFRELMQASEELGSYEYLITIETELTDVGDDDSMKSILKFAVDKALDVLETERKRLGEVSEQCPRNTPSAGKAQQAISFVTSTVGILKSIQPRL